MPGKFELYRRESSHRFRLKRSRLLLSVGAAVILVGAGTAYAAVPSADGTFKGCVNQATGILRVIDPAKTGQLGACITTPGPLKETPISWNAQGVPGTPGAPGATGPAGGAGPAGPKGDPGAVGTTGAPGPVGPKGDPGPIGATGPQGLPGDPGPTGPAGASGSVGPKGDPGPIGATGPQGLPGDLGPTGPAGDKGDAGPAGAAGQPGPQGIPGPAGPLGPQGPAGTTGQGIFAAFGTAGVTPTNPFSLVAIPGLTLSLDVPAAAKVMVTTDGGVANDNATSAVVDIVLIIDGHIQPNAGFRRFNIAANEIVNWSFALPLTLGQGQHTVQVGTEKVSGVNATVSSASGTVIQGQLSAVVIRT